MGFEALAPLIKLWSHLLIGGIKEAYFPPSKRGKLRLMNQLELPRTERGSPYPIIHGRVRVDSPFLVWNGPVVYVPPGTNPLFPDGGWAMDMFFILGVPSSYPTDDEVYEAHPPKLHNVWINNRKVTLNPGDPTNPTLPIRGGQWFHFINQIDTNVKIGGTVSFYDGRKVSPYDTDDGSGTGGALLAQILDASQPAGQPRDPDFTRIAYAMLGKSSQVIAGGQARMGSYRNMLTVALTSISDAAGQGSNPFVFGPGPQLPPIAFEVSVPGAGTFQTPNAFGDEQDPAQAIYDWLTQHWGNARDPSRIDLDSFQEASDAFLAEGIGYSSVHTDRVGAAEIIERICAQGDGVVFTEPRNGKLTIDVARADYDPDTIPHFQGSAIVEVVSYTIGSWRDTFNRVEAAFSNREIDYERDVASDEDEATAAVQNDRRRTLALDYPGVATRESAASIASRELGGVGRPLSTINVVLDRSAIDLRPCAVFKLTYPEYGIDGKVFRVGSITFGQLFDNRITVVAVEDVYDNVSEGISEPPLSVGATPVLVPLTERIFTEAPYWLMKQAEEAGIIASADQQRVLAVQRQEGISAESHTETRRQITLPFVGDVPMVGFRHAARVDTFYSKTHAPYDTVTGLIVYDITQDISAPGISGVGGPGFIEDNGHNLILVGDELMSYEGFTDLGDGRFRLNNVWRELLDTVPADHDRDTPVYWLGLDGTTPVHPIGTRPWSLGHTVRGQALPKYGPFIAQDGAATDTITIVERGKQPLRCADLVLHGRPDDFEGTAGLPVFATVAPFIESFKDVSLLEQDMRLDAKARDRLTTHVARGDAAGETITDVGTFRFDVFAQKVGDDPVVINSNGTFANKANVLIGGAGHGVIDVGLKSKNNLTSKENWQSPTVRVDAPRWRNLLACARFMSDHANVWTPSDGTPLVFPNEAPFLTSEGYVTSSGGLAPEPPLTNTSTFTQTVDVSGYLPRGLTARLDYYYAGDSNGGSGYPVAVSITAVDADDVDIDTETGGPGSVTSTTSAKGSFLFEDLPEGTAKLRVELSVAHNANGTSSIWGPMLTLGQMTDQLLTNPSFDVDTTGWTTSLSASTDEAYVGAGSLLVFDDLATQDVTLDDGWQYGTAVLRWVDLGSVGPDSLCQVSLFALGAGDVQLAVVQHSDADPEHIWRRRRLALDLPAGTIKLRVRVFGISETTYVDDFDLRVHKHLDAIDGINDPADELGGWSLVKTLASAAWDAGASSLQSIWGDGYLELRPSGSGLNRKIGFANAPIGVDDDLIAYGFYLADDGSLFIAESGAETDTGEIFSANDLLRIERTGTEVTFLQNGAVVYTSAIPSTGPLFVAAALFSTGSSNHASEIKLYEYGTEVPVENAVQVPISWRGVTGINVSQRASLELDWSVGPSVQKVPATWQQFHHDFPHIGVLFPGDIPIVMGGATTTPSMPNTDVFVDVYAAAWSDGTPHVPATTYVMGAGTKQFGVSGSVAVSGYRFERGSSRNVIATGDHVTDFGAYTAATPFTVVALFHTDEADFDTACGLFGRRGATRGWDVEITADGCAKATLLGASGSKTATRPTSSFLADGAVHMVAISYDPDADMLRIYDERGFTETDTSSGLGEFADTGSTPFRLGRGRTTIDTLPGDIMRCWIFDRVLTGTEIASLWGLGKDPLNVIGEHYKGAWPRTAAALTAALGGFGDFTGGVGYLLDEVTGNVDPMFGTPSLAPLSSPLHRARGVLGGTDKAVDFNSGDDAFSGGDVHNGGSNDVFLIWASLVVGVASDILGKWKPGTNTGYAANTTNGGIVFWSQDGTDLSQSTVSGATVGERYVGMGALDRGDGLRAGLRTMGEPATALGSTASVAALGSITNDANFRIGDQDNNGAANAPPMSVVYAVTGASVATGVPANLAAILKTFVDSVARPAFWIDTPGPGLARVSVDQLPIGYDVEDGYGIALARTHQNLMPTFDVEDDDIWFPSSATLTPGVVDPTGLDRGANVTEDAPGGGLVLQDIAVTSDAFITAIVWLRWASGLTSGTAELLDESDNVIDTIAITLPTAWERFVLAFDSWAGATPTAKIRITAEGFDIGHVVWIGQGGTSPTSRVYGDALATVQSYAQINHTMPTQFSAEGEIEVEALLDVEMPASPSTLVSASPVVDSRDNARELLAASREPVAFQYTVTGAEGDLAELVITLPTPRSDTNYIVLSAQEQFTYLLGMAVLTASKQVDEFTLTLTGDATAGDVFSFLIVDLAGVESGIQLDHYDGAAALVSSLGVDDFTTLVSARGRWSRSGLLDQASAFAGVIADDAEYGRSAAWTDDTTEASRATTIYLGASAQPGDRGADALLMSASIRTVAKKEE